MQSDWPEDKPTYLKFDRIMVDMLVEIDPSLRRHVITTRRGYKLMYGKLNKAVYGTLLGSILFYKKLATQLHKWDFIMNPYDACTWNKMVNGKQLTIQYFIDDLHISCVDGKAIDNLVHNLNDKFKMKFKELTVCKGKVHDYLGINIDYSNDRYVKFTMYNFIKDVLKEARGDMNGTSPWPADGKLFSVDPQSPKLDTMDAYYFHRTTAWLLFACKQARPDIQVAVAFLCTRVKAPTEEDYKKLTWVIRYLRNTIHLPLLIGWDETGVLTWSVDAAFAVHKDMRSHTGAALTMGKGALLSMSLKQKINTKSSTEAELVGVDDAMNFVVWTKLFFDWQMQHHEEGMKSKEIGKTNILLQDNTSAIQLEQYGKRSSTKRTRHINIRYFYITDKLQDKTVTAISYCPTKEMVSDYLSKPLQGSLFQIHRNSIMGLTEEDEAISFNAYHKQHKV